MKLFLLLLLLIVTSCASVKPSAPPVVVDPPVVSPPIETPSTDKKPYLTVKSCTNCTDAESKFIQAAVIKTNETVDSVCFADFMTERKMIQTNNKDSFEVLLSLVGADISIDTEMYYTSKKVLGYTLANQPVGKFKEWINRRYMSSWNACDLASLLGHETAHKIGYGHDYYATANRNSSVPYSVNAAFTKCCVR